MKAISFWQPWASFMALGWKHNETRHWSTSYRGPLLIHAAKRKPPKDDIYYYWEILKSFGFKEHSDWFNDLPLGAIVCRVNLRDCQQIAYENCPSPKDLEYHLGNYDHGRWMWITDNLKMFDNPIPYRGQQGLFNVPDEILLPHSHSDTGGYQSTPRPLMP